MANFGGRRAPNVSQYVANLNTIPSEYDLPAPEDYSIADDLATFTNAEFYDWDNVEQPKPEYDAPQDERVRRENATAARSDGKGLDFGNGDYTFSEIDPLFSIDTATKPNAFPIQPTYQPQQNLPQPGLPNHYNTTSPPFNPNPYPGTKRQASSPAGPVSPSNLDDASKNAIDEDKRRRNTAASARFRVKKKQREQALERTAKDLTDKANALQARIGQLEMENEWLRKLVIDKNGKESFEEQWGQFRSKAERIPEAGREGVGTESK